MRQAGAVLGLLAALVAADARAGDSVCWILDGVLLVPATAAGVNGVFILDTGQAQSQLDATQASEADIGNNPVLGEVRFAGRRFKGVSMPVEALDSRTRDFPIPIAGVLGADLLADEVLEVRPDPCRLRLEPTGRRAGGTPVVVRGGVPFVQASASDGVRAASWLFRLSTGSPAASSSLAVGYRLRALSVDGMLFENVTAVPASGPAAEPAIGEPVWALFALRLDLKRKRLWLTPEPHRKSGR